MIFDESVWTKLIMAKPYESSELERGMLVDVWQMGHSILRVWLYLVSLDLWCHVFTVNTWSKVSPPTADSAVVTHSSLMIVTKYIWLELFILTDKRHGLKSNPHSMQEVPGSYATCLFFSFFYGIGEENPEGSFVNITRSGTVPHLGSWHH